MDLRVEREQLRSACRQNLITGRAVIDSDLLRRCAGG
jgi:hypothetical protein